MRRALLAALVLGAVPLYQGCCLGTISRFDGDFPLPPMSTQQDHWDELVSGEGGALLRERGSQSKLLAVTARGAARVSIEKPIDWTGAQVLGGRLYRSTRAGVVRSPLDDPEHAEVVAAVEGARALAVSGDTLVVAHPGGVVLVRGASSRTIWQGEAIALALDGPGRAAWIVGREPLAVIDQVSLEEGHVLCRIPLPPELVSPNVRVVVSGKQAVVFAHDRPLESALLIAPDLGRAWRLGEVDGWPAATAAPEREAEPPLLVPATLADPGSTFGRVVPLAGGRFIVASTRADSRAEITMIGRATFAETPPARQRVSTPTEWPGVVAGLLWTGDEVVVAADDSRFLHVKGDLTTTVSTPLEVGTHLRHGFNYIFNAGVALTEIAVSIPLGVGVGCILAPWGVPLLLVEPQVGLLALTSPVWLPFVRL